MVDAAINTPEMPADVDLPKRRRIRRHGNEQRRVPVEGLRELLRLGRRQSQNAQADLTKRRHIDAVRQGQLRRTRLKQARPAIAMIVANHHHRRDARADDLAIEPAGTVRSLIPSASITCCRRDAFAVTRTTRSPDDASFRGPWLFVRQPLRHCQGHAGGGRRLGRPSPR